MKILTFLWFALFAYAAVMVGYFLFQNHHVLVQPVDLVLTLPPFLSVRLNLEIWSLVLYSFGVGVALTFSFLFWSHLKGRRYVWAARRDRRRLLREIEVLRAKGIEGSLSAIQNHPPARPATEEAPTGEMEAGSGPPSGGAPESPAAAEVGDGRTEPDENGGTVEGGAEAVEESSPARRAPEKRGLLGFLKGGS